MSYEAVEKLLPARKIDASTFENHRTSDPHGRKSTPGMSTKVRPSLLMTAEAKNTFKRAPTITTTPNTHPFPNPPQPCTSWAAREKHDVVASFTTTRLLLSPRGIVPLQHEAMDDDVLVVEVTVAAAPTSEPRPSLVSLSEPSSIAPAPLTSNATSSLGDAPSSFATLVKTASKTPVSGGLFISSSSSAASVATTLLTATPNSQAQSQISSIPLWTLWCCLTLLGLLSTLASIIYYRHVRGAVRLRRVPRRHSVQRANSTARTTSHHGQNLTTPLPARRYNHHDRTSDAFPQLRVDGGESARRLDAGLDAVPSFRAVLHQDSGRYLGPCLDKSRSHQDCYSTTPAGDHDRPVVGASNACHPVVSSSVYTSGSTPRAIGSEDSEHPDDGITNSQLRKRRHQYLPSPARNHTTLATDLNIMDLESQTSGSRPQHADRPTRPRSFDKIRRSFSGSALLTGLVDGLANQIVSFTNDGEGSPEDGLLLPISTRDRRSDVDIEVWF